MTRLLRLLACTTDSLVLIIHVLHRTMADGGIVTFEEQRMER